jgi:hypothetical protein
MSQLLLLFSSAAPCAAVVRLSAAPEQIRVIAWQTCCMFQAAEAPQSMLEELWEKMLEEAEQTTRGRTLASNPANHHDVLEISKRLWGDSTATNLYATHRLLREDEVFFYRLKTRPPTFHVRSKSEVDRLRQQKQLVRPSPSLSLALHFLPLYCTPLLTP